MTTTHRPSVRPYLPALAGFFVYALLMRVTPYVLHHTFGLPLTRAYDAYPWNFSPLFALAVFGGAMFRPWLVWTVPFSIYLLADVSIAMIQGGEWGFYSGQVFTYLGIAAVAACGLPLRSGFRPVSIAAAGLGGTTAFFVITNLGVWLTGGGFSRPLTPAGLLACFVDAIPFYGPTLLSMAIFLPVLFSPLVLVRAGRSANAEAVA